MKLGLVTDQRVSGLEVDILTRGGITTTNTTILLSQRASYLVIVEILGAERVGLNVGWLALNCKYWTVRLVVRSVLRRGGTRGLASTARLPLLALLPARGAAAGEEHDRTGEITVASSWWC